MERLAVSLSSRFSWLPLAAVTLMSASRVSAESLSRTFKLKQDVPQLLIHGIGQQECEGSMATRPDDYTDVELPVSTGLILTAPFVQTNCCDTTIFGFFSNRRVTEFVQVAGGTVYCPGSQMPQEYQPLARPFEVGLKFHLLAAQGEDTNELEGLVECSVAKFRQMFDQTVCRLPFGIYLWQKDFP